jgi:hypothetical protein
MHTPTTDHHDQRAPGECPYCTPDRLCPRCMGRLARHRYDCELRNWQRRWGNAPRFTPRARPLLRLVLGGRR